MREVADDMDINNDALVSKPRKAASGEKELLEPVIIPLCDVAGYACFVAWAFIIGWDAAAIPVGFTDAAECCLLRAWLFAGAALGSLALFLAGRVFIANTKVIYGIVSCALCLCPSLTFFVSLPPVVAFLFWFLGGFGQAGFFLIWGNRFRVLNRQQQLYTVCGAFLIGGLALALSPFIGQSVVLPAVAILPLASHVFLTFARRRWSGEKIAPSDSDSLLRLNAGGLKKQIPFQEDRKFILLKGMFAVLYSVSLGFATCAALANWFHPLNEVVIGLSDAVAAILMMLILRRRGQDQKVCSVLSKLFLAITSVCWLSFVILWPNEVVLACAAILLILFGCYEIISAHTAYVYSVYDAVRCLWEISSSKTGNAVGFFLGWAIATASLYYLNADSILLIIICFSMVAFSAVIDTAFFKDMKLDFREVLVGDEPMLEIRDAKFVESLPQGKGKWSRTCEKLSEKYKLSPRQKEIFFLLAKGRNVQFIKDKLVLSTPTVKSHVYSVYQKMGVHSHQELIDLVESEVKTGNATSA